jgi:predicted DNA-binding protein
MKPITHHLTERQIERLKAEAQRTGLTVAEIIRRAVDAWLDRAEKREGKKP